MRLSPILTIISASLCGILPVGLYGTESRELFTLSVIQDEPETFTLLTGDVEIRNDGNIRRIENMPEKFNKVEISPAENIEKSKSGIDELNRKTPEVDQLLHDIRSTITPTLTPTTSTFSISLQNITSSSSSSIFPIPHSNITLQFSSYTPHSLNTPSNFSSISTPHLVSYSVSSSDPPSAISADSASVSTSTSYSATPTPKLQNVTVGVLVKSKFCPYAKDECHVLPFARSMVRLAISDIVNSGLLPDVDLKVVMTDTGYSASEGLLALSSLWAQYRFINRDYKIDVFIGNAVYRVYRYLL